MSEHRQPTIIWKVEELPEFPGKESGENCKYKIELFPAYLWADKWEPGSKIFSPRPPLHDMARKLWWEHNYRIRVNGSWYEEEKGIMQFMTKGKIFNMFFN